MEQLRVQRLGDDIDSNRACAISIGFAKCYYDHDARVAAWARANWKSWENDPPPWWEQALPSLIQLVGGSIKEAKKHVRKRKYSCNFDLSLALQFLDARHLREEFMAQCDSDEHANIDTNSGDRNGCDVEVGNDENDAADGYSMGVVRRKSITESIAMVLGARSPQIWSGRLQYQRKMHCRPT